MSDERATGPMGAERVASEIRRAILSGELRAGEHVRQEVWAERLGISRVPVREAMNTLETRGLLVHDANRGFFVAKLSMADLAQLYRIRLYFETTVIESIRWPDADELLALESIVDRLVEAARSSMIDRSLEEERTFFFTIYDLSPLGLYVAEAKRYWDLADPYRATALATRRMVDPSAERLQSVRTAMLEALERHDRPALMSQIERERTSIIEFFESQPGAIVLPDRVE